MPIQAMRIPTDSLSPAALRALVEEFITREGTEYGWADVPMEKKVGQVLSQLKMGAVAIVFDPEAQTTSLVPVRDLPPE